jgi:hypothetical protein
MMQKPAGDRNEKIKKSKEEKSKKQDINHLGSSDAFEKTENPQSQDPDNISDEKLDELLGD